MTFARLQCLCLLCVVIAADAAAQGVAGASPGTPAPTLAPTLRITSPLGRTGTPTTVRIVAQLQWPAEILEDERRARVSFRVDGVDVGSADRTPYAVVWVDDNPFEPHEIVAEAEVIVGPDGAPLTISDRVTLPPFEIANRTEVKSIIVEAAVYDKKGRAVSTLGQDDFRITENGEPQKIDMVVRETLPTTIALLVDNSQSMARRMDAVRSAADRFARELGRHDKVIVVPFNHQIGTITGPTNDIPTIAESIAAMRAGGGTAIMNALEQTAGMLDGIEGRRAIILITDGFDENSTIEIDAAVRALQIAQVTVYTVAVGGVTGVSRQGELTFRQLTSATGGRSFFPWRDADLAAVAAEISHDTHSRYLMTYTPSNQRKDGTWRAIQVHVPEGLQAVARAGYLAPQPPPIRPTIEFTVTDAARGHVAIAPDDLEVYEDGIAQSIDTFQEAVDPVSIVLVLDASGSMAKAAEIVKQTARDFVAAVRPEDSLSVITFADEPKFGNVLSTNRENSLRAIERYTTGGGTALYDALWDALRHLRPVKGRRAIVLVTDGRDENNPGTGPGSVHTFDEVVELGRQVGATIFSIGLGTRIDKAVLERLARMSGGAAYLTPQPVQLAQQFRGIIENLRQRYVLSYTSTNSEPDGAWRSVEIRPKARGLVVSASGGYFAPTQ